MPKLIAHALTGATIIVALNPKISVNNVFPIFIGVFLALSPDLDLLVEWLFGIPHFHRGLTHSFMFSLVVMFAISLLMNPLQERALVTYFLAYLSHPLLDLITSTTGGVKILYPFSNKFYHLGLTSIFELPTGTNLSQVFAWIKVELLVFLPIFLLIVFIRFFAEYLNSNINS